MWLLLCRDTVTIFGFLGFVALPPFVPLWLPVLGAGAAAPAPLSHLGSAGACAQVRQCPEGLWAVTKGQGGGAGPGQISVQISGSQCRSLAPCADLWLPGQLRQVLQDGLALPPAQLWQVPGIACVFLALSPVREGTRNIPCPGGTEGGRDGSCTA